MRILTEGNTNSMRVNCSRCKALLEIEARDLDTWQEIPIAPTNYSFKCPLCSYSNILLHYEVPNNIKNHVKK